MQTKTNFLTDDVQDKSLVFHPGEGEVLALGGSKVTLKVTSSLTNDQLGIYEITLAPGTVGARMHYHRFTSETFIVTQGVLTVQLQSRELQATEGAVVYVPCFTPHGFSNTSNSEVKLMLLFNPGQQREGFFYSMKEILSESPTDPAKFLKLYNKYDSFPVDADNVLPVVK